MISFPEKFARGNNKIYQPLLKSWPLLFQFQAKRSSEESEVFDDSSIDVPGGNRFARDLRDNQAVVKVILELYM